MPRKKISRQTAIKLLENIEVEIGDNIAELRSLSEKFKVKNLRDGAAQWRRIKTSKYSRLKGALNLVYMSSDLEMRSMEIDKINIRILDVLKLTYYD